MQNLRTALGHKSVIIPNQNLYDFIIIFRSVWKRTVCAYLDFFAILLYVGLTSGTVWHTIHRTITCLLYTSDAADEEDSVDFSGPDAI